MKDLVEHATSLNSDEFLKWEYCIKELDYEFYFVWDGWDDNARFTRFHGIGMLRHSILYEFEEHCDEQRSARAR